MSAMNPMKRLVYDSLDALRRALLADTQNLTRDQQDQLMVRLDGFAEVLDQNYSRSRTI